MGQDIQQTEEGKQMNLDQRMLGARGVFGNKAKSPAMSYTGGPQASPQRPVAAAPQRPTMSTGAPQFAPKGPYKAPGTPAMSTGGAQRPDIPAAQSVSGYGRPSGGMSTPSFDRNRTGGGFGQGGTLPQMGTGGGAGALQQAPRPGMGYAGVSPSQQMPWQQNSSGWRPNMPIGEFSDWLGSGTSRLDRVNEANGYQDQWNAQHLANGTYGTPAHVGQYAQRQGMSGGGAFNPGLPTAYGQPQFGGGMGQFMQQANQFGNRFGDQNALLQALMGRGFA